LRRELFWKNLSVKENKQTQLDVVAKKISACRTCKKEKIGVAVPGEGNPDADIVFIGEAPGKKEAKTGRPFIGPAGKLLRGLIKGIDLDDTDVFITSVVKYLPEYVTPKEHDIIHGRKHLFEQIDIIDPTVIVLLGNTAVIGVLGEKMSIAKVHGTIIKRDGRTYLIAYHPAAPLYSGKLKVEIEKDFSMLKKLCKIHKKRLK